MERQTDEQRDAPKADVCESNTPENPMRDERGCAAKKQRTNQWNSRVEAVYAAPTATKAGDDTEGVHRDNERAKRSKDDGRDGKKRGHGSCVISFRS